MLTERVVAYRFRTAYTRGLSYVILGCSSENLDSNQNVIIQSPYKEIA